MNLSEAQARAVKELTYDWQNAGDLKARLDTLGSLVGRRLAQWRWLDDNQYRLRKDAAIQIDMSMNNGGEK